MADYQERPLAGRIEERTYAGGAALASDPPSLHQHGGGTSWGAIFAGALGAVALSLVLLLLGTGLGIASVSPWTDRGASAAAVGIATVLWLTFTQIAASGMGGYLAGRLRSRWLGIHVDEVYFRDTAHGFLAWAVATLITAGLLTSAVGSILGAGASVAGGAASAVASAGAVGAAGAAGAAGASGNSSGGSDSGGPMSYFVDSLFRRDPSAQGAPAASGASGAAGATSADAGSTPASPAPATGTPGAPGAMASGNASGAAGSTGEVTRIFANAVRTGTLPPDDAKYVGSVVAQRTGMSPQDAEKRVTDTYAKLQAALNDAQTKARDAADKARKASAYASLWLVVSMLIGAFVASFAAIHGGRRRDV